jgi:hypothetical protein
MEDDMDQDGFQEVPPGLSPPGFAAENPMGTSIFLQFPRNEALAQMIANIPLPPLPPPENIPLLEGPGETRLILQQQGGNQLTPLPTGEIVLADTQEWDEEGPQVEEIQEIQPENMISNDPAQKQKSQNREDFRPVQIPQESCMATEGGKNPTWLAEAYLELRSPPWMCLFTLQTSSQKSTKTPRARTSTFSWKINPKCPMLNGNNSSMTPQKEKCKICFKSVPQHFHKLISIFSTCKRGWNTITSLACLTSKIA